MGEWVDAGIVLACASRFAKAQQTKAEGWME